MDNRFRQFRRKQIGELRPFEEGEALDGVSISKVDRAAGSPKLGDMIARNPKNHEDQWLVSAQYFTDNFDRRGMEESISSRLEDVLEQARDMKNGDRSEHQRLVAILCTKIEDALAFAEYTQKYAPDVEEEEERPFTTMEAEIDGA